MLSTLSSVKSRLAIPDFNVEFDDLLTTALTALSARFDRETNRTLSRTANTTHEFDAIEHEIIPPRYAVEQVAFWFQNRDHIGVLRNWPHDGTYQQFGSLDLLPSVSAVLQQYKRW